jgi:hypothetical protein
MQSLNDAISFANYATAVIGCVVAAITLAYFRRFRFSEDVAQLLFGAKLVLVGLGIHQAYWGLARLSLAYGRTDINEWFLEHAWLVTGAYAIAFYGMLKIIAVWHEHGRIRPIEALSL